MMFLKNSYKQANNVLRIKVLCLVENKTKVKTGEKNLVKNTPISHSLPLFLISSSSIFVLRQVLHKSAQNLGKKNLLTLTLVHANSTALRLFV